MLLLCKFPVGGYGYIQICKVFHLFPMTQQMQIASFVPRWAFLNRMGKLSIPNKIKARAVLIGADNSMLTDAELRQEASDRDPYVEGFLYRRHRVKQYKPELIQTSGIFFELTLSHSTNDCLVHSINYALRCPWFVAREQVVALMARNSHRSIQYAQQEKVAGGPSISHFKDFAIVDGKALSL